MVDCVQTSSSWMDEIIEYLGSGKLPTEKVQARRVRRRAAWYVLKGEDLLQRSFTLPDLKCLREVEIEYVIREVHKGVYGNHLSGRSLVGKILRQGYY